MRALTLLGLCLCCGPISLAHSIDPLAAADDQLASASSTAETLTPSSSSSSSSSSPTLSSSVASPPAGHTLRHPIPTRLISSSYNIGPQHHRHHHHHPSPAGVAPTISAHLNSLHSAQDGPPKTSTQQQNNKQLQTLLAAANLPASISMQQLQQFIRAYSQTKNNNGGGEYSSSSPPQLHHLHQHQLTGEHHPQQQLPPPRSSIYSHIQTGRPLQTAASGGYILSVNTDTGETLTSSGPTPVLMQYLPQSQPTSGGIQYLQLIPTRPLIVPISPFMPQQPQQQQQQHQQPQQPPPQQLHIPRSAGDHLIPTHNPPIKNNHIPPSPSYATYAASQGYLQQGPITYASGLAPGQQAFHSSPPASSPSSSSQSSPPQPQAQQPTNSYPLYQNPAGNAEPYSSAAASSAAPVVQFFRPHTGIQLINGPIDMSLNTNEYIPVQGESAYKVRRA